MKQIKAKSLKPDQELSTGKIVYCLDRKSKISVTFTDGKTKVYGLEEIVEVK